MRPYPEAIAAATEAQHALESFSGLHRPPDEWLHMSVYVAGSTEEIAADQLHEMVDLAQDQLDGVGPIPVSLGKVLYHPEAIMLRVEPRESLIPLLDTSVSTTARVTGAAVDASAVRSSWDPHVTVSYSTSDQDAGPLVAALGKSVPRRHLSIDTLTLVVQWGPEREWDWEPVGAARLTGGGRAPSGRPDGASATPL